MAMQQITEVPEGLEKMVTSLTLRQRAVLVWQAYRAAILIRRVLSDEGVRTGTRPLSEGQQGWLREAAEGLDKVLP